MDTYSINYLVSPLKCDVTQSRVYRGEPERIDTGQGQITQLLQLSVELTSVVTTDPPSLVQ